MADPTTLDDFDVIRTPEDLEVHQRARSDEPAWVLLSPTLLPGAYLLEQGRLDLSPFGDLCRAEEVVLEALGAGDAERLVGGFLMVARLMEGLYARAVRQVEEVAEARMRTNERPSPSSKEHPNPGVNCRPNPHPDGIRMTLRQAIRVSGARGAYRIEVTDAESSCGVEMPEAPLEDAADRTSDVPACEVAESGIPVRPLMPSADDGSRAPGDGGDSSGAAGGE